MSVSNRSLGVGIMKIRNSFLASAMITFGVWGSLNAVAEDGPNRFELIKFGTMHEAIGQQQHQGRVQLGELVKRPGFYGVAALEELQGEVTLNNGEITITAVNADGQLEPAKGELSDKKATLLAGAYVSAWSKRPVTRDIGADQFDAYVATAALEAGIKTSEPFVFKVDGEFRDVYLHVINGACPIHARLKNKEIPKELQSFETEMSKVKGTLIGVYAKDAVGKLTHPATSTHVHLLYKDPKTGANVTAHLERVGIGPGSVISFPK
jgi:alpha-acetolactate decarboxylase